MTDEPAWCVTFIERPATRRYDVLVVVPLVRREGLEAAVVARSGGTGIGRTVSFAATGTRRSLATQLQRRGGVRVAISRGETTPVGEADAFVRAATTAIEAAIVQLWRRRAPVGRRRGN